MSDSKDKIASFQPKELGSAKAEIRAFKPQSLNPGAKPSYDQIKKQFGSLAATDAASNPHFSMYGESKKLLGIEAEERGHIETQVKAGVEARLEEIHEKAYRDGFEQGRTEGKTEAEAEFKAASQPAFDRFTELLESFDSIKHDLLVANEKMLIQLVFQIGKQVLLRDLKTDVDYVKRLTSEMVEKVGAKDSVRIKINRDDFAIVEQIRDHLKAQFPELKNIQFESVEDLVLGGCKVETDLSRVNSSVEIQLKLIEAALGGS